MRLKALLAALLFALPFVAGASNARAGDYYPRQYYSSWYQPRGYNYYYRYYYYKPSYDYYGYKHHYVFYYPSYPNYYYYYNPYKKYYWGRCPTHTDGAPQYALLPEGDRKGDIDQIPESAFPQPAAQMPPIPESTDKTPVDLPPDDLPTAGSQNLPRPPKAEVRITK